MRTLLVSLFSVATVFALSAQEPSPVERGGLRPGPKLGRQYRVYGAIADKWRELGRAAGPLGAPVSDESDAADGGRFNAFQNGFIYWHPRTGAHAVYGAIGHKWNELGRERAFGYPITDEREARNGGRYNDFEHGASIYWHPSTGAHVVYGAIRAKWHEMGREASGLGYPVTDEQSAAEGGRFNDFQGGMIYWHPTHGAHSVYGGIGLRWIALGREQSYCGYPTRDEYDFDDGRDTGEWGFPSPRYRRTDFVKGYLLWSKGQKRVLEYCGPNADPASGSVTYPTKPVAPPAGEACSVSVVVRSDTCLNEDGTPSQLPPGGSTGSGCGSTEENALARAKLSFQSAFPPLSDSDEPEPGTCTYTVETYQECMCR